MADRTFRDPLGRFITLHDHTWYGHVLQHHAEMRRHRHLVEEAIQNPLEIRFSDADPDCRLYFGSGPRKRIMIVVAANVVEGFVKTAHLVTAPKGAVEWLKPTP